MIVAATLFGLGWLIGRIFTILVLSVTSCLIMVAAMIIFVSLYGLDLLHVLITLGYLAAHQSGFLIGAYRGGLQPDP